MLSVRLSFHDHPYRFPNDDIDFRISGNYILRVTEQGREEEVLFERAFFVTEQAAPLDMRLDNVLVGGRAFASVLPIVQFTPPPDLRGNVFDYDVCFVRNGQFDRARCTDRANLAAQPALQFYLEPEMAFEPQAADYFLDLSAIRVGPQIEAADFGEVPYEVRLEPDYARFPGAPGREVLHGQSVVSGAVRDVPDADLSGEYVEVVFSYVPPEEQPLEGDLVLTGSFNGWQYDPANRLAWVPERGRYEGAALIKQGLHEYRYFTPDRRLRRLLTGTPPQTENLYTSLIYYNDIRLNTDRLLAAAVARMQ